MEGFHYYNMFETKGLEYILTIIFFALLIPFWMILNKKSAIGKRIKEALGVLSLKRLKIPMGIYHSADHLWMYLSKAGIARIGFDDLMMHITGEISVVPVKQPGETIKKGDLIAYMNQKGKQLKVFSPISGSIKQFNTILENETETITSDPYGNGWMYEIKPSNWIAETSKCYVAEDAINWTSSELVRFKDFLSASLWKNNATSSLLALQDGGELREHLMSELPQEIWDDFQNDYLKDFSEHKNNE